MTEVSPRAGRPRRHAAGELSPDQTTAGSWNSTGGAPYGNSPGTWQNHGGVSPSSSNGAHRAGPANNQPAQWQAGSSGYYQPVPDNATASPYSGTTGPGHHSGTGTQGYGNYGAGYAPPPNRSGQPVSYGAGQPGHAPDGPAGRGTGVEQGHRGTQPRTFADDLSGPARGRHATDWDSGFDRVVGWTLLGGLLPGSGLVAAGRRGLGWLVVSSWVLVAVGVGGIVLLSDPLQFVTTQVLEHPERMTPIAIILVILAVLWAAHLVVTNMSLRRFAALTGVQSALSWLLVATLAAGGVGAGVAASQWVQLGGEALKVALGGNKDSLSDNAKKPDTARPDPWAEAPRINVLLIGSDAGADRKGVRTDTVIVASIDTKSGNTVLFSLPRNLEHVPFPKGTQQAADYPDGFFCPDHECMLNALWQFGEEHKQQYYKNEKSPGLVATIQGVEETLGLSIDQYAMLSLRGFMQFVDAIGGTTINVKRTIPVGGKRDSSGRQVGVTSYIKAGKRKLNGYQTLWYARSRSDSDDFERMSRQRCVIAALTEQADPVTLARGLPGILRAARDNITTSISAKEVSAFVTLALRVQKAQVRSLAFTNRVIASGDPDFDKIKELVQKEIDKKPTATKAPSPTTSASPSSPSSTKRPKPTATHDQDSEEASDVKSVC